MQRLVVVCLLSRLICVVEQSLNAKMGERDVETTLSFSGLTTSAGIYLCIGFGELLVELIHIYLCKVLQKQTAG
jgi:hypothetical protein